MQSLYELAVL